MRSIELLDWDDLRIFLDVARTGSIAQTARRLKVEPSTVSRRVAQLESALGVSMFERNRSGLKLTELGQRILLHAANLESSVFSIRSLVGADTAAAGHVRLATMEGIASLYVAPRLLRFRDISPDVTVELVTSAQVIHVSRREADLFLSFFKPPGQGLVSEKIGSFQVGLYASPLYLSRHGAPASLSDLRNHHFATYIDDMIQVDAVRWLEDIVSDVPVVFHSNSMIAQMNAAASGLGIVALPRFAGLSNDALVQVLPEEAVTNRDIWVNVHQDLQFAPRLRALVQFLKQQIKTDMAGGRL
ncbi:MAG: LysR family transcriptional regulator [Methylobacterium sp.]|nr:MAG: LysR family transcriptional regulator [Methylobacterium sp.]